MLICAVSLNAQNKYFNLTPHWFVSVQDSTKNYVVITIDSCSADKLYKKTINYINLTYKSPESVIRGKSENEFLTFVTHDKIVMKLNRIENVDIEYFTTISYKDNKIKITFTDVDMYFFTDHKIPITIVGSGWSGWHIYKEDGSIFFPKKLNKERIEEFFNNKVDEIISGIKNSDIKNENW
jgi:hypothetical protein